jgi:hypothetical protein
VNSISNTLHFTYDCLENSTFKARKFGGLLAKVLRAMRTAGITVAEIPSDPDPFHFVGATRILFSSGVKISAASC